MCKVPNRSIGNAPRGRDVTGVTDVTDVTHRVAEMLDEDARDGEYLPRPRSQRSVVGSARRTRPNVRSENRRRWVPFRR